MVSKLIDDIAEIMTNTMMPCEFCLLRDDCRDKIMFTTPCVRKEYMMEAIREKYEVRE